MAGLVGKTVGPTQLGTSAATIYSVPASTVFQVLQITATNITGSAVAVRVSYGADAAGTRIWHDESVPANGMLEDGRTDFLPAGTIIQAYAGTGSAVNLVISGIESS